MKIKFLVFSAFVTWLFPYKALNATCIRQDDNAIKGKVTKCFTAEKFFKQKYNEETSRTPNYKSVPDVAIEWDLLIKYPDFRKGFVLSIEVTHKRSLVFECKKFLANEIPEPFSWKDSWVEEDRKPNLQQQYLFSGESCPPADKEMLFFRSGML